MAERLRKILMVVLASGVMCPVSAWPQVVITISKADCSRLINHVPDADVAYQPGVDVKGRKVAPADVAGTPQIKLPDKVTIDIGFDLGKKYNIPGNSNIQYGDSGYDSTTQNLYTGEGKLGQVVWQNGQAWYNGQPLTSEDQAALAAACAKQQGVRKR